MTFLNEIASYLSLWASYVRRRPLVALLLIGLAGVLVYFYGLLPLYGKQALPIWQWAWMRFLPEYNQEHSKAIPIAVLGLLWYHRAKLRTAQKRPVNAGLAIVMLGILFYLIAARVFQPRIALFALPLILYGSVLFLWGREVSRIVAFPFALLFFMIPLGALEQTTFRLQFLVIGIVKALSRLCGIALFSVGTSIHPINGDWGFDIAEGCSGVRSLIAMVMITCLYVHLRQIALWKKIAILCFSILFAIVGNAGRVFTIILLARLGYAGFAGGLYHEWSGQLIFFPIALLSMIGFARLLDAIAPEHRPLAGPAVATP